jgi:hypothetical protein
MSDRDKLKEKIAEAIHKAQMGLAEMSPAEAALSAIEAEGHVMAPREPTGQMVASVPHIGPSTAIDVYRAMIGASPFVGKENADV